MSDTTKSVDDELFKILVNFKNEIYRVATIRATTYPDPRHSDIAEPGLQAARDITQLFTKQLSEAEIRARIDESTPNASDDGKVVRVHVPQRNHINGTDYDNGWNDCWNAFWSARWKRVGELTQDTKGGTEQ